MLIFIVVILYVKVVDTLFVKQTPQGPNGYDLAHDIAFLDLFK